MVSRESLLLLFKTAEKWADFLVDHESFNKYAKDYEKSKFEALLFCTGVVSKIHSIKFEDYQKLIREKYTLPFNATKIEQHIKMHKAEVNELLINENYMGAKSAYHIYFEPLEDERDLNFILNDQQPFSNEIVKLCMLFRFIFAKIISDVKNVINTIENSTDVKDQ